VLDVKLGATDILTIDIPVPRETYFEGCRQPVVPSFNQHGILPLFFTNVPRFPPTHTKFSRRFPVFTTFFNGKSFNLLNGVKK
jgi:hypothetical protein